MRRILKHLPLVLAALLIVWSPLRAQGAEKKPAVVIVHLPAEAELFIGGVKSKRQTELREFDTPPLTLGKRFLYPLKAVWKDGDKDVTHARTIVVMGGETTHINLLGTKLSPPIAEKLPAPELMPEIDTKPVPKPEPKPAKKPDPQPGLILTPEPKPEPEKKPDVKPVPEKKPEPKEEVIPQPKPKLEPKKKPDPKPEPLVTPPKPVVPAPAPKGTLSLLMPETLNLQPGETKLLPIKVIRTHCKGPVSITFEGLPSRVALKNTTVAADKQKVYVQAAADAGVEEKEWEVQVVGNSGSVRQEIPLKIKIAR